MSKFFRQLEKVDINTDDDILLEELYQQDPSYVIQAMIGNNMGYFQEVVSKFSNIDESVVYGLILESIDCALTEYPADDLDHSYKSTAREILENKLINHYKKENRKKRGGDCEISSIENLRDFGKEPSYCDTYNLEYEDNIMSQEDLSGIQKKICLYIGEGYNTKDIAEILGVTRQNIEKHYDRIKFKIKGEC